MSPREVQVRGDGDDVALVTREAMSTVAGALQPRNLLLRALPRSEFAKLWPHLETVSFEPGSVVFEAKETLARVHFLETGMISLLAVLENRATVAAAAVGREGAIELATLLLGGKAALGRYQVVLPVSALSLDVSRFRLALRESLQLQAACEASAQALLLQVLLGVSCGRSHTIEQRCARWLLMCADRSRDDRFELEQQSLAEVLGVPQPMVSAIARKMQRDGLISRRGALTGLDRPRLEIAACECYRIVRDRLQRLLVPPLADS
jgi:CRP-like cAMP-binding protein